MTPPRNQIWLCAQIWYDVYRITLSEDFISLWGSIFVCKMNVRNVLTKILFSLADFCCDRRYPWSQIFSVQQNDQKPNWLMNPWGLWIQWKWNMSVAKVGKVFPRIATISLACPPSQEKGGDTAPPPPPSPWCPPSSSSTPPSSPSTPPCPPPPLCLAAARLARWWSSPCPTTSSSPPLLSFLRNCALMYLGEQLVKTAENWILTDRCCCGCSCHCVCTVCLMLRMLGRLDQTTKSWTTQQGEQNSPELVVLGIWEFRMAKIFSVDGCFFNLGGCLLQWCVS